MMKCVVYSYLTGRSGINNNQLNVRNDFDLIELSVPPMLPMIIVVVSCMLLGLIIVVS